MYKKTTLSFLLPFILLLFCFLSIGCKKCKDPSDPDCENYNPCYDKTKVHAGFNIAVGYGGFPKPGEWCDLDYCDTTNRSNVRFIAFNNDKLGSTYEWHIGSDTNVKYGREIEINFTKFREQGNWNATVPISLILKTPASQCLQDLNDTMIFIKRNLVFRSSGLGFYGEDEFDYHYEGYFENEPSKKVTLTWSRVSEDTWFREYYGRFDRITGFPDQDTLLMGIGACQNTKSCSNYNSIKYINLPGCDYAHLTGNTLEWKIKFHGDETFLEIFRLYKRGEETSVAHFIGKRK